MTAVSDLVVARSQVTIRTEIYASLAADGVTVQGLDESHILRALPEWFSGFVSTSIEPDRVRLTQAGFLSEAVKLTDRPGWMYLLSQDFFSITPDPAVATQGVFIVTAAVTAGASTIPTGAFIVRYGAGSAQRLFTNSEGFTPVPGSFVDVPMIAQEAGSGGNIPTNTTLSLVTAYPGLTVTNPGVGSTNTWITLRGRDAETLVSIKSRCEGQWAALSYDVPSERWARIIREAFEAAGQTNPITRIFVDDTNPYGPGSVAVYMAREAGPATTEDVALVDAYVEPRYRVGGGPFKSLAAGVYVLFVDGTIKGPSDSGAALAQAAVVLDNLEVTFAITGTKVYKQPIETALFQGVTGAINVILTIPEETTIPQGSLVDFQVGSLAVIP